MSINLQPTKVFFFSRKVNIVCFFSRKVNIHFFFAQSYARMVGWDDIIRGTQNKMSVWLDLIFLNNIYIKSFFCKKRSSYKKWATEM